MLKKQTQPDILSQPEKRVRMNETFANISNLKVNGLKIIQSMTTASPMRLDEAHNLSQKSLVKSHNSIVPRTDLGMDSSVRPAYEFTKFLTKTSSKMHEPKTYNKAINDLIYENKWCKVIDKKL